MSNSDDDVPYKDHKPDFGGLAPWGGDTRTGGGYIEYDHEEEAKEDEEGNPISSRGSTACN